ncbi:MAG: uracil phosphoribosyltransferase [Terrimicrobiaceae bacterium]|jgi:uracil phosphoribosyltransferase
MKNASPCQVVDHPLVRIGVTTLRDRQTTLEEFRRCLRQLSILMAMEAVRDIETNSRTVETPLAKCEGFVAARPTVVFPILRAGLGMAEALLTVLPAARVGHVGLYRDEQTFEPKSYYFKAPDLANADVFLVDPMLATGQSAADAVDKVKGAGAKRLRMLALIGSVPGVEHFHARHPDVPIFLAALDPSLNEKAYIVPGLGDAGDRYFGT